MTSVLADAPPVCLFVVSDAGDRRIVPVTSQRFTIGRDRACALVVDDRRVSRLHASLGWFGGDLVVTDLGSTNGITCNGRRVLSRAVVQVGDVLAVGGHRIWLQGSLDATVPGAALEFAASRRPPSPPRAGGTPTR